jgi:hypothetical protein
MHRIQAKTVEPAGISNPYNDEFISTKDINFIEKVFFFLLPCLNLIEIKVVGRLFLPEIILACCLPFLIIKKGRMLRDSIPRMIITLGVLWLASQILTDIVRATPFEDYSRGWAKITFTLINFSALYILLYKNRQGINYFIFGIASYYLLIYFFNPSPVALDQWWKFGLGVPLVILTVLLCQTRFVRRKPLLPTIVMMMVAVISIGLGSRSLGGLCFLMGSYYFIDNISVRSPFALRHISLGKKILIASSIVIFFFGFQYVYQNVISRSTEDVKEKEKSQAAGDYGLFLGGRTEIISSFYAIRDSPILGHGSWAKNPYYDQMMYYFLKDAGYKAGRDVSELIPTHSHLWGAWVESGILGAIFWGYIFFLTFKVPLKLYKINEPIKYVTLFVAFTLLWDILFSPYGADRRLTQPFFTVVILTVLDNIKLQTQIFKNKLPNAN